MKERKKNAVIFLLMWPKDKKKKKQEVKTKRKRKGKRKTKACYGEGLEKFLSF